MAGQGTPMFMAPEMILGKAYLHQLATCQNIQEPSSRLPSHCRGTPQWPIFGAWESASMNSPRPEVSSSHIPIQTNLLADVFDFIRHSDAR